jgi:hypothetical protein
MNGDTLFILAFGFTVWGIWALGTLWLRWTEKPSDRLPLALRYRVWKLHRKLDEIGE